MELRHGDKLKFIGCHVVYREACRMASESPCTVDLEFLPKGLHDLPREQMLARLQQAVDAASQEGQYRAILMGYARCNDGLVGLQARQAPLIVPRAHDCISFFFGGHSAFHDYFHTYPGTYYRTTGWYERESQAMPDQPSIMDRLGLTDTFEQLVAKYGRENAEYIAETLKGGLKHYTRLCYLEMGATDEREFIQRGQAEAGEHGWEFDLRRGDWTLFRKLFLGPWDGDFVSVPTGGRLVSCNDGNIMKAEA